MKRSIHRAILLLMVFSSVVAPTKAAEPAVTINSGTTTYDSHALEKRGICSGPTCIATTP